ncbi:hypothetical protein M422DRAFT_73115 [Sphaerobolus stellatus SS14]|nr:hypothetical protein M422DRAFT_73115 [Sphaerobolus stellatus SS14]
MPRSIDLGNKLKHLHTAINLRSQCGHFRILILGRANAGKTTLLKRVCNSIEDPEIFTPSGEKDLSLNIDNSQRGMHDIQNQLIFKSNPQFIFHDSRGFESGSKAEIQTVRSFIDERARRSTLSERLHAIWYCLPTDTNRPLFNAEKQFFDYHNREVPVIAIFTKLDGLVNSAFRELWEELGDDGITEARKKRAERAQEKLQTDYIDPLMATSFPPSNYVQLEDMRKESSSCKKLIEQTENALSDDTLKLLFVSVQQNNIDLCIRKAVKQ